MKTFIKRLYLKLMCKFGKHQYRPWYTEVTYRSRRGNRFVKKRYICECAICGEETKPLKYKNLPPMHWNNGL